MPFSIMVGENFAEALAIQGSSGAPLEEELDDELDELEVELEELELDDDEEDDELDPIGLPVLPPQAASVRARAANTEVWR